MSEHRTFKVVIPCSVIDPDSFRQKDDLHIGQLVFEVGAHSYQDAAESFTRILQEYIKEKENA